ncbi:MAG: tRNA (adenine-N1)-methyltransferase [Nitrospirae bacterium]|nr:tRNA (adenine-N1)-methyltransferase [Nitrospirota bacterium]
MKLRDGERIHFIDREGRHYPLTLRAGKVFQFSGDTIPHDDLIGTEEGREVVFSRGTKFWMIRPTLSEYLLKMPRGAQVIYPKDIATILLWGDIYPGARVLEAGVGSGALTMALLRSVGDRGTVTSYEVREDFAARARENVAVYLGATPNFTVRLRDIYEGIEEQDHEIDRLILDLPEPWQVVPHAVTALRPGGIFLCYLPTIVQTIQVVKALQDRKEFIQVESFETLLRGWHIEGSSVRPDHRMVAHTAFITVARRVQPPVPRVTKDDESSPSCTAR